MSTEQRPTAPGAERPAEDADFANAADPCCELDPDGRITRGNRALANVLGHAPETLRGVRLSELIHPDDRALAEGRIGRLDPWIRAAEFTVRLRCASGAYRWLAWTLWRDGDRPGLSGRAEDVTPEREDDLQRHTFFNQSRDMLCLANTDGYFLRINPAFHHILGRSEEELLSRQFLDWVHPDDIGPTQDALVDLADGDQIIGFENRYQISDGSYRWLHWMSVANVADGTVYAVARDITEHKQAQRDLTAAPAAAEAANRAKSAFLATMSHELRTPLNAILGYAEILLRHDELSAERREQVKAIRQSGQHLLTLIDDILDLSKIEAGKLELCEHTFGLDEFLATIVDMFTLRARDKRLSFVAHLGPDLPLAIRGDETRLRQVLINLLSNAVKFTKRGGVTLRVDHDGGALTFRVEDTGVGIPADRHDDVFQPFEQLSSGGSTEGIGLGLTISQRLVSMMGGTLELDSEVGRGTHLWFAIRPEVDRAYRPARRDLRTIDGYEGTRRTVLIVDDKRENRAVLGDLLGSVGFAIIEASDGHEAIEQTRAQRPDIIIMDLVMPGLDGFEASRRICAMADGPAPPIIAASASVFEHHRRDSLAAGCVDFIAKPISAASVFDQLGRHLQLSWRYRAAAEATGRAGPAALAGTRQRDAAVGPLDPDRLRAIYQAACIGDVREILDLLSGAVSDNTAAGDGEGTAAAPSLVDELHTLAMRFKVAAIRERLEPLLARSDTP